MALDSIDGLVEVGAKITEFGDDISIFFHNIGHGENCCLYIVCSILAEER